MPDHLIHVKPGVLLTAVSPVMLHGLADLAVAWFQTFPDLPFVVTSVQDGQHAPAPQGFHPQGLAFDFRTQGVARPSLPHLELFVRGHMREHPGVQILLEHVGKGNEHGHWEFDGQTHPAPLP